MSLATEFGLDVEGVGEDDTRPPGQIKKPSTLRGEAQSPKTPVIRRPSVVGLLVLNPHGHQRLGFSPS